MSFMSSKLPIYNMQYEIYKDLIEIIQNSNDNKALDNFCLYLSTFTISIQDCEIMYVDSENNLYSLNEVKEKFKKINDK